MSKPFKFKHFEIVQDENPLKVGTDAMVLGSWTAKTISKLQKEPKRILDIGTGTGVLALMMAQSFEQADITAIEPETISFNEAQHNFAQSKYKNRILGIKSSLQQFGSMDKFDLIICNPPYFNGTYLSDNLTKNNARHNTTLETFELYEGIDELLNEDGSCFIVIPHDLITEHLERAFDNDLYLHHILHSVSPSGNKKRAFICLGKQDIDPIESTLLIKNDQNQYSAEYVELTKEFHGTDLTSF
ncbi:methyltransferase [Paracrocinitomix mangrovi]|uniref:tRNA1(Val) (adenine(37)-N6)-methyltransferase n=1 Tax=Paracrocinitomix mangrovi TaxID=2862509 RepID=UPI001C8D9B6C|nr:methyltransferase [Paracrocinitomix mangrovi]UKN01834.1 methyltransferase [Paracrocinitomix mangrovi]